MKHIDDIQLCEIAAGGELAAIEALYKRHYELMVNFGLKYYNDTDFIMDCIQDLFVKLICRPSLFSGVRYVRPWLLASLRNIIFDRLKTIKAHVSLDELPFSEIDQDFFMSTVDDRLSMPSSILTAISAWRFTSIISKGCHTKRSRYCSI